MELAAQQLLRAVRGKRSQAAFARRLGYRSNPITDWENGRRYPTAEEALRAAALCRIDVASAFARFVPWAALERQGPGRGYALGAWLRQLSERSSIAELAARSGVSRFAIGRWLAGVRRPRLPDFLRVVDAATGRVPELVAELVPIERVPALHARYVAAQAARHIAFDEPWTEPVLRVMETSGYAQLPRHQAGVIAERLGISREQEARALALLEAAQLVRRDGDRYGDIRPLTVSTRGGQQALRELKRHWALVAAERALAPSTDDLFAYNVISVSAADLARIRELLRSAYRELRSIVAASEPADQVALINVHLVGWNGAPDE